MQVIAITFLIRMILIVTIEKYTQTCRRFCFNTYFLKGGGTEFLLISFYRPIK